jgi:integrase
MAWRLLAFTGMRRGEALALRWRDVDLDAGRVAVRRSVGVVKDKGRGEQLVEGATNTGQSRVVDLDAGTVAALRTYRAVRGSVALDLVRDTALVLGALDGSHRHPEWHEDGGLPPDHACGESRNACRKEARSSCCMLGWI